MKPSNPVRNNDQHDTARKKFNRFRHGCRYKLRSVSCTAAMYAIERRLSCVSRPSIVSPSVWISSAVENVPVKQ